MIKRKFEATVLIQRDIEEIFQFMTDFSQAPLWTGVVETKQTSDGPIGMGTTFVEVVKSAGQLTEVPAQITEYTPFTAWAFKSFSQPFPVELSFKLEALEDGTNVTGSGIIELSLAAISLLAHLIVAPTAQRKLQKSLENLKTHLEGAQVLTPSSKEDNIDSWPTNK